MTDAKITEVYLYFSDNKTNGYTLAGFQADWKALDETSKAQFRAGIGDKTFTY